MPCTAEPVTISQLNKTNKKLSRAIFESELLAHQRAASINKLRRIEGELLAERANLDAIRQQTLDAETLITDLHQEIKGMELA